MAIRSFERLSAVAAPIDQINLDTDQILPARFLRKPRDEHYHRYLFADLRFRADGSDVPEFVLNRPQYSDAEIIVGARNFGCGSSREAAVYALEANGIRALIAPLTSLAATGPSFAAWVSTVGAAARSGAVGLGILAGVMFAVNSSDLSNLGSD